MEDQAYAKAKVYANMVNIKELDTPVFYEKEREYVSTRDAKLHVFYIEDLIYVNIRDVNITVSHAKVKVYCGGSSICEHDNQRKWYM
uniref:Uncharacterized protein n=1 Tax=Pithovirus LCPAC403 TaxID=2506596 RepID=A0A481ZCW7_9VIRU|nr:MAG: hypothetical protein LCPAC403_03060 [Pithovirus LCPAC403]